MTKTSMAGLSETMQQRLKDDQQAVIDQTDALLKLHAKALQQLSLDALNTTGTAIKDMQSVTLQRIRRLMILPIASVCLLSLLIVSGSSAWAWWTVQQAQQKLDQINQIEQTEAPAGQGRKG